MTYDSASRMRESPGHVLTVIDRSGVRLFQKIGEYRHYRTLFVFLALRDVTLRYRQTVLGVVWAVLQPLLPMLIFTVVFARVLRPSTGGAAGRRPRRRSAAPGRPAGGRLRARSRS